MANRAFKLPDIGEGTAEAELVVWHVAVGDRVEEEQPLCDVMTDKATVEVTSPFAGTVVERHGSPGEMLAIGSVVLVFALDDAPEAGATASAPELSLRSESLTPALPETAPPSGRTRTMASPAVRQRAAELGIDLAQVHGSGPQGRVRQADIETYLAYARPTVPVETPAALAQHVESSDGEIDEIPVVGLRRRIAERMQDTKRRIPHFSYIEEIDASQLEALRTALNAEADEAQPRLTILPFLIVAMIRALGEFPHLNARFDDTAGVVQRHRSVHVGIATQTQSGLVVTVLRHAERRGLWDIAQEIARLSREAKAGRANPADLKGSTITITSLGAMGGLATTPVINSPEVAIIGVNKMIGRPVVRDGRIEVAKMMNLSSSFDHRVVDGWDAASFIQRMKSFLESPARLFVA